MPQKIAKACLGATNNYIAYATKDRHGMRWRL